MTINIGIYIPYQIDINIFSPPSTVLLHLIKLMWVVVTSCSVERYQFRLQLNYCHDMINIYIRGTKQGKVQAAGGQRDTGTVSRA